MGIKIMPVCSCASVLTGIGMSGTAAYVSAKTPPASMCWSTLMFPHQSSSTMFTLPFTMRQRLSVLSPALRIRLFFSRIPPYVPPMKKELIPLLLSRRPRTFRKKRAGRFALFPKCCFSNRILSDNELWFKEIRDRRKMG